jgi:hypothetical protein
MSVPSNSFEPISYAGSALRPHLGEQPQHSVLLVLLKHQDKVDLPFLVLNNMKSDDNDEDDETLKNVEVSSFPLDTVRGAASSSEDC